MFVVLLKICLISVVSFLFSTFIIFGAEISIKLEKDKENIEVKRCKKGIEFFSNIRTWSFFIFTASILGMIITF